MFSIIDVSGAFWTFHDANTLQMTKWCHDLDNWHCTT